jgi:ubiquinone/menaquinone biosynthesis C-methylase UbiE
MSLLQKMTQWLRPRTAPKEIAPAEGYNLLAAGYDHQPSNLMMALDAEVFAQLLNGLPLQGQHLVDVGCGTGRHWPLLLAQHPASLTGYDVSSGMLAVLRQKMPTATTYLLDNEGRLAHTASQSCHLVLSNLTIGYIPDAAAALREWHRVLLPGGYLLITDYHPTALAHGATRSFSHQGQTLHLQNEVHTLDSLQQQAGQLGLHVLRLEERCIDDGIRPWYAAQGALALFERFKGTPIIYGLLLQK